MPVFDFSEAAEAAVSPECTYTVFSTDSSCPTPAEPLLPVNERIINKI